MSQIKIGKLLNVSPFKRVFVFQDGSLLHFGHLKLDDFISRIEIYRSDIIYIKPNFTSIRLMSHRLQVRDRLNPIFKIKRNTDQRGFSFFKLIIT